MRPSVARLTCSLFILCLAATLLGCEPDTPEPTASSPTPVGATATPMPSATAIAPDQQPEEPPAATSTATPTPTPESAGVFVETPTSAGSRCANLTGELEIKVLVGPAEAVGLEPVAVGSLPFAVTEANGVYLVAGQGPIDYEATLPAEWGDYEVTMNLDLAVEGECAGQAGAERLALILQMSGEQLVLVHVGGQEWSYPWSGTQSLDLDLPLTEGATAEGEGWIVVLHTEN